MVVLLMLRHNIVLLALVRTIFTGRVRGYFTAIHNQNTNRLNQ